MIGIIGAMDVEIANLREQMIDIEVTTKAGMEFLKGTLYGKQVVLVRSGIGKVNAACCTQILCDQFGIDCVINTGIAGSLDAAINIGDIVIATDALQHDMDATQFGYAYGIIPQMKCSDFVADEATSQLAERVCREVNPDIQVFRGRIVSGDQFVASKNRKMEIVEHFHGMCTEMEGAAIAQAAYLNEIPFVILRAISDKADDSASEDYGSFEKKAVEHMVRLMGGLLQEM